MKTNLKIQNERKFQLLRIIQVFIQNKYISRI